MKAWPKMSSVLRCRTAEVATAAAVFVLATGGCGRSGKKPDNNTSPQPASDFTSKIEAIKQAGEPVALAELDALYPTPPADQNAAPLYAAAFAALVETDAKSPSFLTKNQKALGLLHQATSRTRCRYPIDLAAGANTKIPHLPKLKTCAQLLKEAAISQAAKGRMDLAAQAIADGLNLAASLDQEPILISQLVRVAALRMAVSALGQMLERKSFEETQLVEIQVALQKAEQAHAGGFTRSLLGERCNGISLFQAPAKELVKSATDSQQAAEEAGVKLEFPDLTNYRNSPAYAPDFAFFLDRMSDLISCSRSAFPLNCQLTNAWASQVETAARERYLLSAMLLPALAKAMEHSAVTVAELRAAQAGLAVERFRSANGNRLPDSLPQLVPQYLVSVPADPFDGEPLRYKQAAPKGFVIYSVGPNRRDDGGTARPPAGQGGTTNFDLTFAILR